MKIILTKNHFLDLPSGFFDWQNAKIVIIPFGLESSVSYGRGTKNGPGAIIDASQKVELLDEELKKEIYKNAAVATLNKISPAKNIDQALNELEDIVKMVFESKKMPIILGGEHTLTKAPVNFFKNKFANLTILQFDAHADLRDSIKNNKNSHGAVMRRCLELSSDINLVQVGIRSISNKEEDGREYDFWQKEQNRIKTFWAGDMNKWQISEIINSCGQNVYLTFDVDVFDPAIMPSTGTPEPGGLDWYRTIEIIKAVAENRKIVGADFVELAPIKGLHAPDFMMAKLIYKFIGYLNGFV